MEENNHLGGPPVFSKLMLPVIRIIGDCGGTATNDQIIKSLIKNGFEKGNTRGNQNRSELEYRAAWAKSYLKAYGVLENPTRGVWRVTSKGRTIKEADIPNIVNFVVSEATEKNRQRKLLEKPKGLEKKETPKSLHSSNTSVSFIDQIKTIITLLDSDLVSKEQAESAIRKLSGVRDEKNN